MYFLTCTCHCQELEKTGNIYVHLCIHTDSPRLHIGVKVFAPLNLGNLRTLMLQKFLLDSTLYTQTTLSLFYDAG